MLISDEKRDEVLEEQENKLTDLVKKTEQELEEKLTSNIDMRIKSETVLLR